MLWHSIDGVPIDKLATEDLQQCLTDGIESSEPSIASDEIGYEQIRIELLIRQLGLK